jgi:hypothetical protein
LLKKNSTIRDSDGGSSASLNPCPYCAEKIQAKALICRFCDREVFLIAARDEKIAELERKLKDTSLKLSAAEALNAPNESTAEPPATVAPNTNKDLSLGQKPPELRASDSVTPRVEDRSARPSWFWSICIPLACIVTLVNLFTIITFALEPDHIQRWLFGMVLLVPAAFASWHALRLKPTLMSIALSAVIVALVSVLAMTGLVAYADHKDWLPENPREWREVLLFVTCVAAAYAGVFQVVTLLKSEKTTSTSSVMATRLAQRIVSWSDKSENTLETVKTVSEKIQRLVERGRGIVTTGLAIWAAVEKFFG